MCREKVIDPKTSLDSFKIAFEGAETRDISFIKILCPKTTFASFMALLSDQGMFEDYPKNFHKVAELITGETDFKNALQKFKVTGTFKGEKKFRELAKFLSVNK